MHWIEELPPDIIDMLVSEQHTGTIFVVLPRLKTEYRLGLLANTLFRYLYPRLAKTYNKTPTFDFIRNLLKPVFSNTHIDNYGINSGNLAINKNTFWSTQGNCRILRVHDGELKVQYFRNFTLFQHYANCAGTQWCSDDHLLYVYFFDGIVVVRIGYNKMWHVAKQWVGPHFMEYTIVNMEKRDNGSYRITIVGVQRPPRKIGYLCIWFPRLEEHLTLFCHRRTIVDIPDNYHNPHVASDGTYAYITVESKSTEPTILYKINTDDDFAFTEIPVPVTQIPVAVKPLRILAVQDFVLAFVEHHVVPIRVVDGRELAPIPLSQSFVRSNIVATEHGFAWVGCVWNREETKYYLKAVRLLDTISFRHKLGFTTINKEPWEPATLTCAGSRYKCDKDADSLYWIAPPLTVETNAHGVRVEAAWEDQSRSVWEWVPVDE